MVVALLAVAPMTARADGEAGIVINWGDGTTSSLCIDFEGDSIGGEQLLSRAALPVNDFSGFVCSIDDVGCTHSGTFSSCHCQCQGSGPDCVYWSFFTRPYGEGWRYSALGYRGEEARDGDLHGWQWVPGAAASSPPSPDITFESVCGHPPGQVVAPTATVTPVPTATATPRVGPTSATTPTATAGITTTSLPASTAPPPVASTTVGATGPVTASITAAAPSPTPVAPASGTDGDGGGRIGLVLFGVVAAILGAGTISAFLWRGRHAG
jgi:hypothetical protein